MTNFLAGPIDGRQDPARTTALLIRITLYKICNPNGILILGFGIHRGKWILITKKIMIFKRMVCKTSEPTHHLTK